MIRDLLSEVMKEFQKKLHGEANWYLDETLSNGSHLGQRVSLVVVEPALHAHHRNALQVPEDQPAHVALDGGHRKVRNRLVVNVVGVGQLVGQRAQTGSENDADFWP